VIKSFKKLFQILNLKVSEKLGFVINKVNLSDIFSNLLSRDLYNYKIKKFSYDLHKSINKGLLRHKGISFEFSKKLSDEIYYIIKMSGGSYEPGSDLLNILKNTKSEDLPSARWLSIYDLCFTYGFLELLLLIRSKAIESAFIELKKRPNNLWLNEVAFRAAIEMGDFKNAQNYLKKLKNFNSKRLCFNHHNLYFNSQKNTSNEFNKFISNNFSKYKNNNNTFRQMVSGKSIALVGPAPTGYYNGKEIDSFDLVVRVNFRGRNKLSDFEEFGSKTDISYYNGYDSKNIESIKDYNFFKELKACGFKSIDFNFQKNFFKQGFAHEIIRPNLFFNGSPLQGSNIIYDLLFYNPGRLKIFNNNLFLNSKAYHSTYRSSHLDLKGNKTKFYNDRLSSFSYHDLVSQHIFLNQLYKSKKIEVDNSLQLVLSKNINLYLRSIKKIYA
jgi:hypothetical protein